MVVKPGDISDGFEQIVRQMEGEVAAVRVRFAREAREFVRQVGQRIEAEHDAALRGYGKILELFEAAGVGSGVLDEILADADCRVALQIAVELRENAANPSPVPEHDGGAGRGAGGAPPRQTRTGLPAGLSRKRAIEGVLEEFQGRNFGAAEVRGALVRRYPGIGTRGLAAGVSNALYDLTRQGRVRKVRGIDGAGGKNVYEVAAPFVGDDGAEHAPGP